MTLSFPCVFRHLTLCINGERRGRKFAPMAAGVVVAICSASAVHAADWSNWFQKKLEETQTAIERGGSEILREVLNPDDSEPAQDRPHRDADWVSEIQARLTALGYRPGPVDGQFGRSTSNAIAEFQADNRLASDGLPRPSLMSQLRARMPGLQVPTTDTPQYARVPSDAQVPYAGEADRAPYAGEAAQGQSGYAQLPSAGGVASPLPGPDMATPFPPSGDVGASPVATTGSIVPPPSAGTTEIAQRFGVQMALGRPMIPGQYIGLGNNREQVEQGAPALAHYFASLMLGQNPQFADHVPNAQLCLANTLLPEAQKSQILVDEPDFQGIRAWRGSGRDEFEVARSRDRFQQEILPQILAATPPLPAEFVFLERVLLQEYDMQREGFAISRLPDKAFPLPRPPCSLEPKPLPFATPLPDFWALDRVSAEPIVRRIPPAEGFPGAKREVYAAAVFELSAAPAAQSGTRSNTMPLSVTIKAVELYEDFDLERHLHSFGVDGPAPAVLLSVSPPSVPKHQDVLLDEQAVALLLLKEHGDLLDQQAWDSLARRQLKDDVAYYGRKVKIEQGGVTRTEERATFDPDYVPFFPSGFRVSHPRPLSAEQLQRFKQWTAERASALPDEVTMRGRMRWDRRTDRMVLRIGRAPERGAQQLVERGYVPDQVLGLGSDRRAFDQRSIGGERPRTPILILANLLSSYLQEASRDQWAQVFGAGIDSPSWWADLDVTLRVTATERISVSGRIESELLAIHAEPIHLRASSRDGRVFEQSFQEVAALDPTKASVATPEVVGLEQAKVPLNAETADLLIARYGPEKLDQTAIELMLLARWWYETSFNDRAEEPLWGRFFVKGKSKPDAQQRAELGPKFHDWTLQRARAVPTKVTMTLPYARMNKAGPVTLDRSSTDRSQSLLRSAARDCHPNNGKLIRSAPLEPHRAQMAKNACLFVDEIMARAPQEVFLTNVMAGVSRAGNRVRVQCGVAIKGRDPYCEGIREALTNELLDRDVDLNKVVILDQEVIIPEDRLDILRGRNLELEVEIDVVGVRQVESTPPDSRVEAFDQYKQFLIEAGLSKPPRQQQRREPPILPWNLFDAHVLGARVVDEKSGEVVATLPLREWRAPDTGLLQVLEPERLATPAEPFGPDVVGIRLGMTFDRADALIRERMPGVRQLQADRAWQPSAATGELAPFTSGRMYIAEDESEYLILYDEPPSAPNVVMGVVRQLNLPKGQVPASAIFARSREKYGVESFSDTDTLAWGEIDGEGPLAGRSCLPSVQRGRHAEIWRDPSGAPAALQPAQAGRRTAIQLPTLRASYSAARTQHCKPMVSVSFDTRQRGDHDMVLIGLVDHWAYLQRINESRRLMEAGIGGNEQAETKETISIDF